ncbi:hypothetical protein [Nonomuraea insulae]|uniref:Uncharacterized protein n=1 Tax=Nonomuraea insulae TaxID=1616787 RepID=A0ABW1D877_9ACTN
MRRHAHLLATAALITALAPILATNPAGGLVDHVRTILSKLVEGGAIPSVADLLERQSAVRITAHMGSHTSSRSL